MGQVESADTKRTSLTVGSKNLQIDDLFSKSVTKDFFQDVTTQNLNPKLNRPIDTVLLSSLLINPSFSRKLLAGDLESSEIEKLFLTANNEESDIYFDQTRTFSKCYDAFKSIASDVLKRHQDDKKIETSILHSKFALSNSRKSSKENFLESLMLIPFNELATSIELLEPEILIETLHKLNTFLRDISPREIMGSSLMPTLQQFMGQIMKMKKFQIPQIQNEILSYLFNSANLLQNVHNFLFALQYIEQCQIQNFDTKSFQLDQSFYNSIAFSYPSTFETPIRSFSIGSHVLLLVESKGLAHFAQDGLNIIECNVDKDSALLDTYSNIFIISPTSKNVICFPKDHLNAENMKTIPLDKNISPDSKILACGAFDVSTDRKKATVCILQSRSNTYRVTLFDESLKKPKKPINLTLEPGDGKPINFYMNENVINVVFDNQRIRGYKIVQNKNHYQLEKQELMYCTTTIEPRTPLFCFKNQLFSLYGSPESIYFVKNQIVEKQYSIKSFPYSYTSSILPTTNDTNITNSFRLILNQLAIHLDPTLQNIINDNTSVSPKDIGFCVDPEYHIFQNANDYIKSILSNQQMKDIDKILYISVIIKVVAINLFSFCIPLESEEKVEIDDNYKHVFNLVTDTINLVVKSPLCEQSPVIMEGICTILSFSFQHLYYPNYSSSFKPFLNALFDSKVLSSYFISNLALLARNNCFYYLFTKKMTSIFEEFLKKEELADILNASLTGIHLELNRIQTDVLKINESAITSYFEFIINFVHKNINELKSIEKLVRNLLFQSVLLDGHPELSLKIIQWSLPIMQTLSDKLGQNSAFKQEDEKYSKHEYHYNLFKESKVIESPHNYPNDADVTETVEFTGFKQIHLQFDPKCRTERNCDVLKIHDRNNNDELLYSLSGSDWPTELDVPTNSLKFHFTSDGSVNYWGYKITCSALSVNLCQDFSPDTSLYFYNLFANILGRLTYNALVSLPHSQEETECKLILDQGILQGSQETQRQPLQRLTKDKRTLSRGISRGLSFESVGNSTKYPDDMKKGFVDDLINLTSNRDSFGERFLQFIYVNVKSHIRANESILMTEKFIMAALMKQLGFLDSAISFAISLPSMKSPEMQTKSTTKILPPNLVSIVKAVYKIRSTLHQSYQKDKERKAAPNKNEEAKEIPLHLNFEAFYNEVITKCKFLLYTEPILKKRYGDAEKYDQSTIDKTIAELSSFLTSDLLMDNLNRMADQRTKRMDIRLNAIKLFIQMIQLADDFKTTIVSFLDPLSSSLNIITDLSEIKSIPEQLIKELESQFSILLQIIISKITNADQNSVSSLLYVKMISVSVKDLISGQLLQPSFNSIAACIENATFDKVEPFVMYSSLWRLIGLWSLQFTSQEIIEKLLKFTTGKSLEENKYNSILLLSALTQESTFDESFNIQQIFDCFANTTPRVIIATFIWLSKYLACNKVDMDKFDVILNNKHYNFTDLSKLLLKAIGQTLCGNSCTFVDQKSLPESHSLIAGEIISFFRFVMKPFSNIKDTVNSVLHQILSTIDMNNLNEQIFELIAIFSILGKEIISLQSYGYAISHLKGSSELTSVVSYEALSKKLQLINNNYDPVEGDRLATYVPSVRILADPDDFTITKDEVLFFEKLAKDIFAKLDALQSIDYSILSASFIGFLTISLQNRANMEIFVENCDLLAFLDCAVRNNDNIDLASISSLINKIGQNVKQLSTINQIQKIQPPKELPYSIVLDNYSPRTFISAYNGQVDGNKLVSLHGNSMFLGDCSLPTKGLFYYELTIHKMGKGDIIVGFCDDEITTSIIQGISLSKGLVVSFVVSINGTAVKFSEGDVVGCGFSQDRIVFTHNGKQLPCSIPTTFINSYVPIVHSLTPNSLLEFNFGDRPFKFDMNNQKLFDFTQGCYESFNVPQKADSVVYPSSNFFDDDDFDRIISNSQALWETTSNDYSDSEQQYFNYEKPSCSEPFNENLRFDSNSNYTGKMGTPIFGHPVLLSRVILDKEASKDHTFEKMPILANLNLQKFATVVDITKGDPFDIYTLEFVNPLTNKKDYLKLDNRFFTPMRAVPFASPISYFGITHNAVPKSEFNAVCYTSIQRSYSLIFNATKYLIIKMSRILSLIFIDYFRLKKQISEYFRREHAINAFRAAMIDVFKFRNLAKKSSKWNHYRVTDFIFTNEPKYNEFNTNYICPCNTQIFARFIRAIIYKESSEFGSIINSILSNSSNRLHHSSCSSRSEIFNLVESYYIFQTSHPQPICNLTFTLGLPASTTGFIPVFHPLTNTSNNVIISNQPIKNPILDSYMFSPTDCTLKFKANANKDLYGLKMCFLLFYDYLPDRYAESALGDIHTILVLLSIILSSTNEEAFSQTKTMLKQKILPSLTELMNGNNFFVDLFAHKITAPILVSIPWDTNDMTDALNKAFLVLTSSYSDSLSTWQPLPPHLEKKLDMSLFTRLLILNVAEKRAFDDSTEPTKEDQKPLELLYDRFTHAAKNKPEAIFDQIIDAAIVCCALGFGLPIPIYFPSYLIAETWAECIPFNKEISFDNSIQNVEVNDMRLAQIKLVSSLPENTILQITESNSTKTLSSGSAMSISNKFSAQLVDHDSKKPIDSTHNVVLQISGYPNSHEAKSQIFVKNYKLFREHMNIMSNWDIRYDEALGRITKMNSNVFTQFPINRQDPLFVAESSLSKIPSQLLRCRLNLIKRLHGYIPKLLNVYQESNQESNLTKMFLSCQSSVPLQYKLDIIKQKVLVDLNSDDKMKITFNRFASSLYLAKSNHPQAQPILDQFIEQVPLSRLHLMKRDDVPWKVTLLGEGSIDAGGPGRDLFTEVCMEIMNPVLSLFIDNPNKRNNDSNENQEQLIPNPQPMTEQIKKRYFYAGVLLCLCYICKISQPFSFARFVWNYLVNRPVDIEDIYTIDSQFKDQINSFENCGDMTPQQFETSYPQNFQVLNSLGQIVELIPGGANIPVTFDRRLEFVQRWKAFRVKEFNEQLEELKKGFNHFFPVEAASLLAPWELELLICGDNQCTVSELKKNCDYDKSEPFFNMLWEVLEEFTPQERMLFIKFGSGRMGLPPPGMTWKDKLHLKIETIRDKPEEQFPLPTSATCSSKMTIPKYRTKEVMAKKIRAAIIFGGDINLDHSSINFNEVNNLF